jgi:hypothetical protein
LQLSDAVHRCFENELTGTAQHDADEQERERADVARGFLGFSPCAFYDVPPDLLLRFLPSSGLAT